MKHEKSKNLLLTKLQFQSNNFISFHQISFFMSTWPLGTIKAQKHSSNNKFPLMYFQ